MKLFYKILNTCAILVSMERLIWTQTHGFRIKKIHSDCSLPNNWKNENEIEISDLLGQPFYFLDSGLQHYVFLGEDQKTILKLFKHYHAGLKSNNLRKLPLPKFLHPIRNDILERRSRKIVRTFNSVQLAYDQFKKKSGLIYMHLSETENLLGTVTLYDKISVIYEIDLDQTNFLLQHRAQPLRNRLHHLFKVGLLAEAIESIKVTLDFIETNYMRGIQNKDPHILDNFGFIDEDVMQIDIGSFHFPPKQDSKYMTKYLMKCTAEVLRWVEKNYPNLLKQCEQELFYETPV